MGGSHNPNASSTAPGTVAKPPQPSVQQKPAENAPPSGTTSTPQPNAISSSSALNQSTDSNGGSVKMEPGNEPLPSTTDMQEAAARPPTNGQTLKHKTTLRLAAATTTQSNALKSPPLEPGASNRMLVDPAMSSNPLMPNSIPLPSQVGSGMLPDNHYHELRLAENSIDMVRRSITTYGRTMITNKKKSESAKKKRKKDHEFFRCAPMPGWVAPPPKELNTWQEGEWNEVQRTGPETVERWMENFRISRVSYWGESSLKKATTNRGVTGRKCNFYLPIQDSCHMASSNGQDDQSEKSLKRKRSRVFMGDELMICLECGFKGSSPKSIASGSEDSMLKHMLLSGHKFGKSLDFF